MHALRSRSWLGHALAVAVLAFSSSAPARAQSTVPSLRLLFMGDIMTGSTWPTVNRPTDPWSQWGEVPALLAGATASFANLEGALTDAGAPVKSSGCLVCYSFRLPATDAPFLARVGWAALSQANNHAGDFGVPAQIQAQAILREAGVASDGILDAPVEPWSHNGRNWVLLAFAPNALVRDLRDITQAQTLIRSAVLTGATVVVSMHAGGEGADRMHVSEGVETFLGENRGDPVAFAHAAIDAGAILVYGHGPHVPRALEVYRGHLIAYSLGNGLAYGGIRREGPSATSPLLDVLLNPADGTFQIGRIHSFIQHGTTPWSATPRSRRPAGWPR